MDIVPNHLDIFPLPVYLQSDRTIVTVQESNPRKISNLFVEERPENVSLHPQDIAFQPVGRHEVFRLEIDPWLLMHQVHHGLGHDTPLVAIEGVIVGLRVDVEDLQTKCTNYCINESKSTL